MATKMKKVDNEKPNKNVVRGKVKLSSISSALMASLGKRNGGGQHKHKCDRRLGTRTSRVQKAMED